MGWYLMLECGSIREDHSFLSIFNFCGVVGGGKSTTKKMFSFYTSANTKLASTVECREH